MTLLMPIWLPVAWLKARKRKEQPNWGERFGDYASIPAKSDRTRLWFHAVSVGEVLAATAILKQIRAQHPKLEIVLSVTTSSGHQTAREKAADLFDYLVYFPLDIPKATLKAMQRVRPKFVMVMETELWMDFLWAAKVMRAKTIVVNGRISDRSFPRMRTFRAFYRVLLKQVDRCLMQSELDRTRILDLGAPSAEVMGNCKFDQAIEGLDADPAAWRSELGLDASRLTVVVGSTRGEFEEAFVARALRKVGLDRLNVVYAPRHIERAAAVVSELGDTFGLRSAGAKGPHIVLDTYGELASVYSVADIVIVGGGFDRLGGQNIIQPLAHGKPVLFGRNMQNFRDVSVMSLAAGAAIECADDAALAAAVESLISNPALRSEMGRAATTLVKANVGASKRYAAELGKGK